MHAVVSQSGQALALAGQQREHAHKTSYQSAGTQWGYGLLPYGMNISQSPKKTILQRPKFEGIFLTFLRQSDVQFQARGFEDSEPEQMQESFFPLSLFPFSLVLFPCYLSLLAMQLPLF